MYVIELIRTYKSFGGRVDYYSHPSKATGTEMKFSVFRPAVEKNNNVPVMFWLSGLTCNEENFITKAGAERWASECGMMIVCPDTSPRGLDLPGEHDSWDFGSGAGFYLNAVAEPWRPRYRMYDYTAKELPAVIDANFNVDMDRVAISGHSMGGHGALVLGLRNPELYRSISAFSPISAPSECPWGQKAFTNYLGENKELWKEYDASEIIKTVKVMTPVLIDQGTNDEFLDEQLKPEIFLHAAEEAGYPVKLRMQEGYDHSYYFIATFIKEHIEFHAKNLSRV